MPALNNFATGAAAGGFVFALVVALAVLVLAFEVWMFIDVFKHPTLNNNKKVLWMLGMLLLHPIIAIIYYFTEYKNKPPLILA
jgi:hypothetical protein